jgi:hypothetical protein
MIFGGLVLIGWVIVVGAVSIYVFGCYADLSLTIILVAIGLILIVLAIPVYKWERNQNYQGKKKIQLNLRAFAYYFFQLAPQTAYHKALFGWGKVLSQTQTQTFNKPH